MYEFYIAHLRFIAAKADRRDEAVAIMMDHLSAFADQIAESGKMTITHADAKAAARGLAGLAGFLQEQILPEAVNAGNETGEAQVRWVIDTSMRFMSMMMTYAETMPPDAEPLVMELPPPPDV